MGEAKNIGAICYLSPNHDEVFDDGIGNKLEIELFNALTSIQRTGLFLDQTFKRRTSPLTLLCLRSHLIMMYLLLVSSRHRDTLNTFLMM